MISSLVYAVQLQNIPSFFDFNISRKLGNNNENDSTPRQTPSIANVHVANDLTGEKKAAVETSLSMLREADCLIVKSDASLSDFAVIDSTVWYGSIPLLGKPNEDACSLRILDAEVAYELASTMKDALVIE